MNTTLSVWIKIQARLKFAVTLTDGRTNLKQYTPDNFIWRMENEIWVFFSAQVNNEQESNGNGNCTRT